MVSITRKVGQSIIIQLLDGRTVKIQLIKTGRYWGDLQAQLGIEAPREVPVDRAELHERRQRERERAKSQPHEAAG